MTDVDLLTPWPLAIVEVEENSTTGQSVGNTIGAEIAVVDMCSRGCDHEEVLQHFHGKLFGGSLCYSCCCNTELDSHHWKAVSMFFFLVVSIRFL